MTRHGQQQSLSSFQQRTGLASWLIKFVFVKLAVVRSGVSATVPVWLVRIVLVVAMSRSLVRFHDLSLLHWIPELIQLPGTNTSSDAPTSKELPKTQITVFSDINCNEIATSWHERMTKLARAPHCTCGHFRIVPNRCCLLCPCFQWMVFS